MSPQSQPAYDLPTAVTFFLAGLGAGVIFAIALSLRSTPGLEHGRDTRSLQDSAAL